MGRVRVEVPRFNPAALWEARNQAQMSRRELGGYVRKSRHSVLTWEEGTAPIPARDLRGVARALKLAPAALLHPIEGEPSLADQRMRLGLTVREVADQTGYRAKRLAIWEATGRLGTNWEEESAVRLASLLGLRVDLIAGYLHTDVLPAVIVHPLATVLHLPGTAVRAAFSASRVALAEHAS